jgi:hypothetical protein
MTGWIRSPSWDSIWILSGLLLGVALTAAVHFGVPSGMILFWGLLLFSTAHAISPIVLAWSHSGFRQIAAQHWVKYAAIPIAILIVSTLAAYFGGLTLGEIRFNPDTVSFSTAPPTFENLKNPFMAMTLLYALWNGYHFGMQNFGVMSLYRRRRAEYYRPSQRQIDLMYCCFVCWAAMLMPFIPRLAHGLHDVTGWPPSPAFIACIRPAYFALAALTVGAMMWREMRLGTCVPRQILILTDGLAMMLIWFAGLWGFAILALNHWLVAIGLAAHVHANNRRAASTLPFALMLIVLGLVVFAVLFIRHAALSTAMLGFTVTAVGARLGLGFNHFLYDRWIYKLSDPRVRATIGNDILPASA